MQGSGNRVVGGSVMVDGCHGRGGGGGGGLRISPFQTDI